MNLCLGTSDKWLCLARLPFHYTEQDLTDLVSKYGKVKHSFLVCSQVTGESKGYGLVKFQNHEGSNLARQFLNGKMLEGEAIQVDWLNSSFIQYSQLHSKCLYVSNLPKNFRDLALFRRIFSVVKNPPYCQVWFFTLNYFFRLRDTFMIQTKLFLCSNYNSKSKNNNCNENIAYQQNRYAISLKSSTY